MKNFYYVFLFAAVSLTGCISSKKYSNLVNEKLQINADVKSTANHEEWLVLKTDSSSLNESSFKQVERSFIPAILYWGWNSTIACEINPALTTEYLKSSIYKAADSLSLSEKLAGGKLIIHINNVPGKFVYQNKGNVIFLVVAYSTSGVEAIHPAQTALVANYEIQTGDRTIPGGEIVIRRNNEPVHNVWKSTKKFTWLYLDQYREDTEQMGLELVQEVIQKLDTGTVVGSNK